MAEVVSMADIEATALRLGIDVSNADLDSIRLPPGEDFGIKSDDDDEDLYQEDNFEPEAGFGNTIVVDNLPVVPPEKFEKLEGVIRKIYSQIGVIREGGLWMPVSPETQKTLGYCFIEYNTPQEAELAREKTNGYKLDKSHIFSVNMFDDFDKFMKVPDEWTPAEIKPYTPGGCFHPDVAYPPPWQVAPSQPLNREYFAPIMTENPSPDFSHGWDRAVYLEGGPPRRSLL